MQIKYKKNKHFGSKKLASSTVRKRTGIHGTEKSRNFGALDKAKEMPKSK